MVALRSAVLRLHFETDRCLSKNHGLERLADELALLLVNALF